jgi:iron complex transport system ATP-binding protein
MLSISNLNVGYGQGEVLRDLSLDVARGQVVGLIGPNGAGKTSLIRAISGIVKPRSGRITVADSDLASLSEAERARTIAVVPQTSTLPPAFTVFECVALGRTPHLNWLGKLGEKDLDLVERTLSSCEINDLKLRRAGELSGGEQQRVLMARALAQDCPILLMDEPTAHLDLHHQVALLGLVRRLTREQNLAVLVALHDLNLAALYADKLALLVNGRVTATGTPAEVMTTEILQKAYQVQLQVHPNPQHGTPWVVLDRN